MNLEEISTIVDILNVQKVLENTARTLRQGIHEKWPAKKVADVVDFLLNMKEILCKADAKMNVNLAIPVADIEDVYLCQRLIQLQQQKIRDMNKFENINEAKEKEEELRAKEEELRAKEEELRAKEEELRANEMSVGL